jgi:DNA polymerase-3 subunit delta'
MQFKDVIGQDSIKSHLLQEHKNNRVSHTQLFLGPQGCNKLPIAIAFSQYLLCENPSDEDSCGECSSCKQVQSFAHPDLHYSYPSLQAERKKGDKGASFDKEWLQQLKENPEFSYDQWNHRISPTGKLSMLGRYESNEIPKQLSLKAFSGGYKIMIIWMQEKMNSTCSNNLLKLLEEPPAKTLIILISENTEQTLPTIISRTQILNFQKLKNEEIQTYLEKNNTTGVITNDIIDRSNGNILEALDLMQGGESKKVYLEKFITLMRSCYTKDVGVMLDWADDASKLGREGLVDFLNYSLYMTRQSLVSNYQNELSNPSIDETNFLNKFARFINGNNVYKIYEELNNTSYYIQRNCNAKIILTGLSFQLMRELHKA